MDDLDHNEQEQILSSNEKDVLLPQTDAAPPVMTQIFLVFAPSLGHTDSDGLGLGLRFFSINVSNFKNLRQICLSEKLS